MAIVISSLKFETIQEFQKDIDNYIEYIKNIPLDEYTISIIDVLNEFKDLDEIEFNENKIIFIKNSKDFNVFINFFRDESLSENINNEIIQNKIVKLNEYAQKLLDIFLSIILLTQTKST